MTVPRWHVRLLKERDELAGRLVQLEAILKQDSSSRGKLSIYEIVMMRIQFGAMTTYLQALNDRIAWYNKETCDEDASSEEASNEDGR